MAYRASRTTSAYRQLFQQERSYKGFTIVELLIVIVVIAILAAITIISYNGIQQRALDAQRSAAVRNVEGALKLYYVDNGVYPNVCYNTNGTTKNNTGTGQHCEISNLSSVLVPKYISTIPFTIIRFTRFT